MTWRGGGISPMYECDDAHATRTRQRQPMERTQQANESCDICLHCLCVKCMPYVLQRRVCAAPVDSTGKA
jgi:hypothetical protein